MCLSVYTGDGTPATPSHTPGVGPVPGSSCQHCMGVLAVGTVPAVELAPLLGHSRSQSNTPPPHTMVWLLTRVAHTAHKQTLALLYAYLDVQCCKVHNSCRCSNSIVLQSVPCVVISHESTVAASGCQLLSSTRQSGMYQEVAQCGISPSICT